MKTSTPERIERYRTAGWWNGEALHGYLERAAAEHPDRLAVADPPNRAQFVAGAPRRLDFAALNAASTCLASDLLGVGIGAGDRLLLQLPNVAELVVAYYAASRLGAVVSPLPVQYGPHELRHAHSVLDARALLTMDAVRDQALGRQGRDALPAGCTVLCFGSDLTLRDDVDEAAAGRVVEAGAAAQAADADRVLTVCWTSGTTGTPKGVPRSHNMWLATARCVAAAGDYRDGDRLLNPFPLVNMASVGGFLYPAALHACSLVLHQPFDPGVFLQQMQQERITFTIVPPAMLNQLARQPELWERFDFADLRAIGSGSAPLAPWMIDTFDNLYRKPIVNFYGSNEGISLFSTPSSSPDPTVRATMFPLANDRAIECRVVDTDTGETITEPGVVGELLIGGPTVFDGYLGQAEAQVFSADGLFHTGDLVEICLEAPDHLRIAGRCKDIINRGGMKLSPAEIDVLLEGLPGVREAAVCAYADSHLGERVCACVVADADSVPDLATVVAHLANQGLAKYKLPERIEYFDALPRNALGKVQRFLLQDEVARRAEQPGEY